MKNGIKTGGRQSGTPNKRTQALKELIETEYPDFNPVLSMVEISQDEDQPINIRATCLKEVASYLYPKRKAVELSGSSEGEKIEVTINTRLE